MAWSTEGGSWSGRVSSTGQDVPVLLTLHLQHQGQCWGTNTDGRSLRATAESRTGQEQ